ncbi:MAG: hypothetical protein Q8O56_09440 [Solirubrobacteraceae bacterium]|nr:hypothetical protein [Solirubrobacteraceae bacterium]
MERDADDPSPTNHRRAVSAAYYALFHTIIADAVLRILPATVATDDDRLRAARWIQHTDVKQAARWVVECAAVAHPTGTPSNDTGVKHGVWELFSRRVDGATRVTDVPDHLRRVAHTFVDLQDARHNADYDHLASFPKATAQRHINAAENALALLAAHTDDVHIHRFLALVVFRSRRLP